MAVQGGCCTGLAPGRVSKSAFACPLLASCPLQQCDAYPVAPPRHTALQAHTVGMLNTGHPFNANGLQRHALPAHLPPALTSSPFSWVTLDVGAMLTTSVEGSEAPAWACAYLTLAPKYSPAGAVPLWAWLRAGGMLGRLLNAACSAVARR